MENNSTDKNIKNLQLLYTKAYEITLDVSLMLRMAIQRELDSGLYVRGDSVAVEDISNMSLGGLELVINNLKKVENNSNITITKNAPKWNKDECKRYFIDAMTPFVNAIERCHKEKGENGEIDFRECTLNGEDYDYCAKICSKDLDELFLVVWNVYFLNGYAEFNDNSEFTFDMYYNKPDKNEAVFADCVFYYRKEKLFLGWNSIYEPYMPEYLNYYTEE